MSCLLTFPKKKQRKLQVLTFSMSDTQRKYSASIIYLKIKSNQYKKVQSISQQLITSFTGKTYFIHFLLKWHLNDGCGRYVILSRISFIIFSDFSMFYQILVSPQVKRWAIITYRHGIYELTNDLPNGLRLTILGNQEILEKCLNVIE